jgi:N utilization substance protein A
MVLISRALSGVKILHKDFTAPKERVRIVVKDEELPKAIGKNGLNATLASKLTGMKIDIISESEYKDKGIVFIQGLSKSVKELLISHGFFTITDILNKGEKELTKIEGIGGKKAKKIFELAQKLMK